MPALRQHMKGKGIIGGKNGLSSLVTDDGAYRGRFLDIQAALQYAQQHCASDTTILLGHSMGAATTMLMAGLKQSRAASAETSFRRLCCDVAARSRQHFSATRLG